MQSIRLSSRKSLNTISKFQTLSLRFCSTQTQTTMSHPLRVPLKTFLAHAKATLQDGLESKKRLTFVVGNESADLDSICSSISLAYHLSYTFPLRQAIWQGTDLNSHITSTSAIVIPLLNLPAADLNLRPELSTLLKPLDVEFRDLTTLSDLLPDIGDATSSEDVEKLAGKLANKLPMEKMKWWLVDHNVLTGVLGARETGYNERVVGIIDHHVDEGVGVTLPAEEGGGENVEIIGNSGSCASWVVKHCREAWNAVSLGRGGEGGVDVQLARLALAPILVDTICLTAEDKVEEVDREAVGFLEALVMGKEQEEGKGYEREAFWKELNEAKTNLAGMAMRDVLRKDYKEWSEQGKDGGELRLGVASLPQGLRWCIGHVEEEGEKKGKDEEKLVEPVRKFMRERKLDVCAIMTAFQDHEDQFRRELFVVALDETSGNGKAGETVRRFATNAKEELELEKWDEGKLDSDDGEDKDGIRMCWDQRNLTASRKVVGPRLRDAIRGN